MARAGVVWRALKTLVWHERLAASPTDALYTVYRAVAPDELSYTIEGRSSAIIIGAAWDRPTPTATGCARYRIRRSRQPVPFWASVSRRARPRIGTVDGHSVVDVSFFDPLTPGWFDARIDERRPAARSCSR